MYITPQLHVGSPTQAGPLSVFPVWTDAPMPTRRLRSTAPKGVAVTELASGPVVERLTVHNPTSHGFLLPGGSVFDGGRQHRALVHSVVVAPDTDLEIDVRCIEQGRWGGTAGHGAQARRVPLAVRGALRGISAARRGVDRPDRRADQGDVWARVPRYEQALGASPTSSLLEVARRIDVDAADVVAAVRPLAGQRGVLIGIGGHPVLLEVFDHPATLEEQWDAIIAGVLADARLVPSRPTPGRRARVFAQHVSARPIEPWAPAGAAIAMETRDDLAAVDGTTLDGETFVHLTALNCRHQLVGAA
jgi:hypothetical protein